MIFKSKSSKSALSNVMIARKIEHESYFRDLPCNIQALSQRQCDKSKTNESREINR